MIRTVFNKLIKFLRRVFRVFGFFPKEPEKPSMEDIQKEEIKEHGVTEVSQPEQVQEEGEVTGKQRKPYIKKSPTSVTEDITEKKQTQEITEKSQPFKKEKIIDLGVRKRKTQKSSAPVQTAISAEREKGETKESEETIARLESPYIETDFDYTEKIHLVLPRQKFNVGVEQNIPKYISYKLKLNYNEEKEVQARVFPGDNYAEAGEQRIYLKELLHEFEVVFPGELQDRVYRYKHVNEAFYIFAAIGDSKGRMLYNVDLLPKKMIWILLEEDYDLASEPGEVEEQWIIDEPVDWAWEKYRPILVDLGKIDILIIRNRKTGIETRLPCEPAFHLESEQLIGDDFKNTCPLFTGGTLSIIAPHENQQGWNVWIQNRTLGSCRLITENWTGDEPLTLNLAEDLPRSTGEFQIDICQRGPGVSDDTLFFRWISYIELNYPKELILPDLKAGHKSSLITVVLDDIEKREMRNAEGEELKPKEGNSFELILNPKEDRCQFSVGEKGESGTTIRICATIPRLKWKTSKQKDWQDKPYLMQRKQLVTGEPLDLLIRTNDFNSKYDISAVLEENEQRRQGPERFVLKNRLYVLDFNRFYETIKHYKDELTLKIDIKKAREAEPVEKIEILRIKPEPKARGFSEPKLDLDNLMKGVCLKRICLLLRQIKDKCPKEKQNSKKIRNIYYHRLRKKQTNGEKEKYKKEFVIKSMVFMKFVMDKYGERFLIKKQNKLKTKIDLFQKLLPKEFDDSYSTFNRRQECH